MRHPDLPVTRLLGVLARGERLAHDCARRQAAAVESPGAARFLGAQARQERFHAAAFDAALSLLHCRRPGTTPADAAFDRLRVRLDADLARNDVVASVIGLQVLFEGLGTVALERLNLGLHPHRERFAPVRHLLLRQEAAHHEFGARFVESSLARGSAAPARVHAAAAGYRQLCEALLEECALLLDDLRIGRREFAVAFARILPPWASA